MNHIVIYKHTFEDISYYTMINHGFPFTKLPIVINGAGFQRFQILTNNLSCTSHNNTEVTVLLTPYVPLRRRVLLECYHCVFATAYDLVSVSFNE